MSNKTPIPIPARIDEPPHLMLWSLDELMPMIVGLLVGIIVEQKLICVFAGFLLTKAYIKFRDSTPDGYMLHLIYAYGFWPSKSKTMINPYIKRLFP